MVAKTGCKFAPTIVVWSWMRTVLNLSGSELLIFSYLYSQTFDDSHKCYTTLSDMSDWFGLTRQTISRNIDKMLSENIVMKETLSDKKNPMIKHNRYNINMSKITQICEESDYNSYLNFVESYKQILVQKFPEDSKKIETYFSKFLRWHEEKNVKLDIDLATMNNLLNELVQDRSCQGISKLLENCNPPTVSSSSNNNVQCLNETKLNRKNPVNATTYGQLFNCETKPTKSKKQINNENRDQKEKMNVEFCLMYSDNNPELLDLLNKFLDTKNGKSYYPSQWKEQLKDLKKYGRTSTRMIESVRNSYKSNYRSLIFQDSKAALFDDKLKLIEKFVSQYGDNDSKLRDLLVSYVEEVPKGQSATSGQFEKLLTELRTICKTIPEMIESVDQSYTHSWGALAYRNRYGNSNESSDYLGSENVSPEESLLRKTKMVEDFIENGYYHLEDEIKEKLITYITKVPNGIAMSLEMFKENLNLFRLYCLSEDKKRMALSKAIVDNTNVLCKEDFAESRKLLSKNEHRESLADSYDNYRKLRVLNYQQHHGDDPRLKNLPPWKPLINPDNLI